ncbi:unnamed protein product, partial [Oppiella nova]
SLDTNKWLIEYGEDSCTAVRRHLYSKNYTTAQIISKYIFTYGKFEIKALLPRGCPLMSHILLMGNNVYNYSSLNDGIFCDDLDANWLDPVFKVEYVRQALYYCILYSCLYSSNVMDTFTDTDTVKSRKWMS